MKWKRNYYQWLYFVLTLIACSYYGLRVIKWD